MPSCYAAVHFINVLALKSPQVGRTLFKKICRRHGILHWPQTRPNLKPKENKRRPGPATAAELKKHALRYTRGPSMAPQPREGVAPPTAKQRTRLAAAALLLCAAGYVLVNAHYAAPVPCVVYLNPLGLPGHLFEAHIECSECLPTPWNPPG